jgi:hypothetical protein
MIRLGGLVSQNAFGKFEQGRVISNPFATAFIKEGEDGSDYEVSMAAKQLDDIIKSATELKNKMGQKEFNVAAWIQDHISKSQDYINQANYGFDKNESVVNEVDNFDLQLVKNMQQTIKDLETKLKVAKDSKEKEMIKKNIAVNTGLMKYWAQRNKTNENLVNEAPGGMRGGVPKMYVAYLGLQKKVRELEDKQKELLQPYLSAKKSNNVTAINKAVDVLKKNQKSLEMYRRNLDTVERQYISTLDKDAEYTGE